jgi:hypothetical protein
VYIEQDFAHSHPNHEQGSSETSSDQQESQENLKRPSALVAPEAKISNSVKLDDTSSEGRPSVYLFIFVNPVSGDRKGEDLVSLPIQHFRLRRFPQVQVEVHNILDDQDRANGVRNIQLIESKVNLGQLPPIVPAVAGEAPDNKSSSSSEPAEEQGVLSEAVQTRRIHVWSAGGDGTVMSVFELLVAHKIDLDLVFFSCK